jgi:hypothetical protein
MSTKFILKVNPNNVWLLLHEAKHYRTSPAIRGQEINLKKIINKFV